MEAKSVKFFHKSFPRISIRSFSRWNRWKKCQLQLAFKIRLEDILPAFPADFLGLSKTPGKTDGPPLETIRENYN